MQKNQNNNSLSAINISRTQAPGMVIAKWSQASWFRLSLFTLAALTLVIAGVILLRAQERAHAVGGTPTITNIAPNSGDTAGGTPVTITGTEFTAAPPTFTKIAAGADHTIAVGTDGALYAWGSNAVGQLGDGTTTERHIPVAVDMTGVLAGKTITTVAASAGHSLALASDGTLYSWGSNANGALGNASVVTSSPVPVAVDMTGFLAGKTITHIASGFGHALAVASDGNVYAWGLNSEGQLGTNSHTNSNVPVAVTTATTPMDGKTIVSVAAGEIHSVAAASDGTVYAWGGNVDGELGNHSTSESDIPVATDMTGIMSGRQIIEVAAGAAHTLALASDGAVFGWGYNTNGEIGDGSTSGGATSPHFVANTGTGSTPMGHIAAGAHFSMAVSNTGVVYTWGINTNGELGNNTIPTNSPSPVPVTTTGVLAGTTVSQISAGGGSHAAVIGADTKAYAWGLNDNGQLGDNSTTKSPVPVLVAKSVVPLVTFDGVAASNVTAVNDTTITLTTPVHDAGVVDVIVNIDGKTATATSGFRYDIPQPMISTVAPNLDQIAGGLPVTITGTGFSALVPEFKQIAAGHAHSLALSNAGTAYGWGSDLDGQLGDNSTTEKHTPVPVATTGTPMAGKIIMQVAAGNGYSLALDTNGVVYGWGNNDNGQLGDNTTMQRDVPVAVATAGTPMDGKKIVYIAAGNGHGVAVDDAGKVYTWGENTYGQLGNNTSNNSHVPVAVVTTATPMDGKKIIKVSAGDQTLAVADDGTAYAWGRNDSGQGGAGGGDAHLLVPVAVTMSGVLAGKTVTQMQAGNGYSVALTSDSGLYAWGANDQGQLANGNHADSPTPTTVVMGAAAGKTLTEITIGSGGTHGLAIDNAGVTYAWGANASGQLGNNSTAIEGSLTAVTVAGTPMAGKTITHVAAGVNHSIAVASDGTTYAWGDDSNGRLGNNSTTGVLLPVAVDQSALAIVTFGGTAGTDVTVVSDTEISVTSPAHAHGVVDIVVTNGSDRTATLTNGFTYFTVATAPQNLTATPASGVVNLAWSAPADNGSAPISDYLIEYRENGTSGAWLPFTHTASTATTASVTGLTPGTAYDFRVSAINPAGTGPISNTATAATEFITVGTGSAVALALTPTSTSSMSSNKDTVTVNTNNPTGYNLTLAALGSLNLVSGSNTITPTSGIFGTPVLGLVPGAWGFRVNNVGGFGATTTQETNATNSAFSWAGVTAGGNVIRQTASPATADITEVWYGASVGKTQASGIYATTVTYTAVAN